MNNTVFEDRLSHCVYSVNIAIAIILSFLPSCVVSLGQDSYSLSLYLCRN